MVASCGLFTREPWPQPRHIPWESGYDSSNPLVCKLALNPLSHTSQGRLLVPVYAQSSEKDYAQPFVSPNYCFPVELLVLWPQVVSSHVCADQYSVKYKETPLHISGGPCATSSSLVLCPINYSCLGPSNFHLCLLNSVTLLGSIWVSHPCSTACGTTSRQ